MIRSGYSMAQGVIIIVLIIKHLFVSEERYGKDYWN
jgi:hypothetical protein